MVSPPCWIYSPFNMAEDGRKERGRVGAIFIWERKNDSSITWESKMLPAIQQVDFFPLQWGLINTEGMPFWTISSEGFHRSHPEKSIMVFTNQSPQRFLSHLWTALTIWTITQYLIKWISSRVVMILIISYCGDRTVYPCGHVVFKQTHTLK